MPELIKGDLRQIGTVMHFYDGAKWQPTGAFSCGHQTTPFGNTRNYLVRPRVSNTGRSCLSWEKLPKLGEVFEEIRDY